MLCGRILLHLKRMVKCVANSNEDQENFILPELTDHKCTTFSLGVQTEEVAK